MITTEMSQAPDPRAQSDPAQIAMDVARCLLAGAAACYLVIYAVLALIRINYAYELEWLEGACVDHVRRILAGQPIYVEPSVSFTPFCYTPLYWYVSAAVAKVVGIGFLPLRLVSLVASFGVLLLIFQFVRRVTADNLWGLVAVGLYAATYQASGTWFDIARVDSLFMLLLLAAVYLVYVGENAWPLLLAGIVMALAFLTKQTAMIVALPLIGYVFLARRRGPALAFTIAYASIVIVSTAAFNIATKQWYTYYVFRAPAHHDLLTRMYADFWTFDLARPLAIALALSLFAVLSRLSTDIRRQFAFFATLTIGMIGSSWLGRVHGAGYLNVLQPAYAFLAIGFALGCHALQSSWRNRETDDSAAPRPSPRSPLPAPLSLPSHPVTLSPGHLVTLSAVPVSRPTGRDAALVFSLYCVGLLQFALLAYSPSAKIPTPQDLLAGDTLIEKLQATGGDVWMPYHGYYTALAGHPTFASAMAINDVLRGPDGPAKTAILADIHRSITSRQFSVILLDEREPWIFEKGTAEYKDLMANYDLTGLIFQDKTVFWPVTGLQTRPTMICTRKPGPPQTQPAVTQP